MQIIWNGLIVEHQDWKRDSSSKGTQYSVYDGGGDVNQAYSPLSTTHGHITDCKLDSVVYAGVTMYACELMWTCLVWAERSTPDNFWVQSHRFNSATGEHGANMV